MYFIKYKSNNKKGFSFVELSIVLAIISLLLITSMPIASNVIKNNRIKVTQERMRIIYQALGKFTASYGRLPCPASLLLAKGNSNYGKEVACGATPLERPATNSGIFECAWSNNLIYGAVPVQALGLPADMVEDGFGSKISYSVIRGFTNRDTFGTNDPSTYNYNSYSGSTYSWQTCNRIMMHEKKASAYLEVTKAAQGYIDSGYSNGGYCNYSGNQQAIFALISSGPNKYGSFPAAGSSQDTASFSAAGFPIANSSEGYNMLRGDNMSSFNYTGPGGWFYNYGLSGSDFYYPYIYTSYTDAGFDDIVFYKTLFQMVDDFNLENLISCSFNISQDINYGGTNYTFYWSGSNGANLNTKYGAIVKANSGQCPSGWRKGPTAPSKRCGKHGLWESGIINHCRN